MYDTAEQTPDDHLLHPDLDERSRQAFAKHLRQFTSTAVRDAAQRAFAQRVVPALEKLDPAAARDRERVREALLDEPEYRLFSDLHHISQEQIWKASADSVAREAAALRDAFLAIREPKGSLALDPQLEVPGYLRRVDAHGMPGSDHADWTADDLTYGALYELGSFLQAPGGGPSSDGAGRTSVQFLREHLPGFTPKRMLDLGCGTCSPLMAWARAFPDAEIHGLDVGAPVLRYAHLRAQTQGVSLHLKQADAAKTGYDSGYFDLVTSHSMFHETEADAVPTILAEAHRVLAPGGVLLIVDLPDVGRVPDAFQQVVFDGDAYFHNEHFWMKMHDLDWFAKLQGAGFPADGIEIGFAPMHVPVPPDEQQATEDWSAGRLGFFAALARKGAE